MEKRGRAYAVLATGVTNLIYTGIVNGLKRGKYYD
jgi:hypothetical protein